MSLSSGALRHVREVCILLGAYFAYMFVRKILIANVEPIAFENAIKVISFESAVGFFWEPAWQSWAIENSKSLVMLLNWAYIITFIPIIAVTATILYIKDRPRYLYYRSIFLWSFLFALTAFGSFPLAPPFFLPEHGFVDTIRQFGPTAYTWTLYTDNNQSAFFYNAFAAMPSLHFGWTILFGVLFLRTKNKLVKVFGIMYPTMTFLAITITGNHYIIDAVGGASIILASYLIHEGLLHLKPRTSPAMASARTRLSIAATNLRTAVTSRTAYLRVAIDPTKSHLRQEGFRSRTGKVAKPPIPLAREKRP